MRLLWMKSDYVIPPDTGGKIRTYNLMRELRKLCDLTYLCFTEDALASDRDVQEFATRLIGVVRPEEEKRGLGFYFRVLRGMASPLPYIVQKYRSVELRRLQRRFCEDGAAYGASPTDSAIVLCDFLEMAENVDWQSEGPKVLFQHNVESEIWRKYYEHERNPLKKAYFGFEYRRMARYEARACNAFDLVFAVSEEDKRTLQQELAVTRPIEVLETGVDTDYFAPRGEVVPIPGRLLFLGSLDWMPNIDGVRWFLEEVYPRIRRDHPGVSIDVVGRRPVEAIRRVAERNPSVRLVGEVEDVRPHVAEADLFVVPLRIGGGSRIKIYEAMAMGRPVVSTSLGAQGLPLESGREISIGDTPEEFAARVVGLLTDDGKKQAIAERGHRFVMEHCDWKRVAERLNARCAELARVPAPAA